MEEKIQIPECFPGVIRFGGCALGTQTGHQAGRVLLERLYREETGQSLPQICTTDRGKPYFRESGYHFSITHTRRHAFCVLSSCPVGLDAEELDRKIRPELARKILSPSEYARYSQSVDKNSALLTFWVLKEAQAKCTGTGLQGYPNQTDFQLDDPRIWQQEGCILAMILEP